MWKKLGCVERKHANTYKRETSNYEALSASWKFLYFLCRTCVIIIFSKQYYIKQQFIHIFFFFCLAIKDITIKNYYKMLILTRSIIIEYFIEKTL